jgi:hypothetical protein
MCQMAKHMNLLDYPETVDMFVLEFGINDYQGEDHKKYFDFKKLTFFEGFQQISSMRRDCCLQVIDKVSKCSMHLSWISNFSSQAQDSTASAYGSSSTLPKTSDLVRGCNDTRISKVSWYAQSLLILIYQTTIATSYSCILVSTQVLRKCRHFQCDSKWRSEKHNGSNPHFWLSMGKSYFHTSRYSTDSGQWKGNRLHGKMQCYYYY